MKTVDFSETFAARDLKGSRSRHPRPKLKFYLFPLFRPTLKIRPYPKNYISIFRKKNFFNQTERSVQVKHCYLSLLAHLSRRLKGELIVYPWSGYRPYVVRPQSSNIFSQTTWPIKAKFYVEPLWVGGTKFCSRHLGHMTKMAAMPIYG